MELTAFITKNAGEEKTTEKAKVNFTGHLYKNVPIAIHLSTPNGAFPVFWEQIFYASLMSLANLEGIRSRKESTTSWSVKVRTNS